MSSSAQKMSLNARAETLRLILLTVLSNADVPALLKHILGGEYDPYEIFPVKAERDNPDVNANLRKVFELTTNRDTTPLFKEHLAELLCNALNAKKVTIVW